jgi:hypothetical protein
MGHEFIPLIHESALAELRTERDELQSCFDSQQELIATLYSEQQDLLSGLEALAGEMEMYVGVSPRKWLIKEWTDSIRALIPAAANTESEEGHEPKI